MSPLPVETSAAPLRLAIARTENLSGQVAIRGQIQPIWDLFLGGAQSLSAQVNAQATLAGHPERAAPERSTGPERRLVP
jgi:translocation and assembly module TamB